MTTKHKLLASTLLVAAALAGCKKKAADTGTGSGTDTTTVGSGSATPTTTTTPTGSAAATGSGSGAADAGSGSAATGSGSAAAVTPTKGLVIPGFQTPESVLYDAANDRYLVSNINGNPGDADGNGYISTVTPDGKIDKEKFIDKLDAPKGTAIVGDTLYVADIAQVRMFDLKTGAAKGATKIEGATFLNDVTPAAGGGVFVSDTGVDGKFAPTKADAVWKIGTDGKATQLAKTTDLGKPNGLVQIGDALWVVTMGTGEIYALDAKGAKSSTAKLPKGTLDGIVAMPDGSVLVSSWESQSVYQGKPGGTEWKVVAEGLKAPADIGYDTKRKKLLVPQFQDNQIVLIDL